jgi:hypothetical protein
MAGLASTLLDTLELRRGSVITKNEITALKKRWGPFNPLRPSVGDECERMCELALPMQISTEQAIQGIDWWRAQCYTKAGMRRNTAFTREMGGLHWHVIEHANRFELVDWHWSTNSYGVSWPFPVYRMIATDGQWFDYIGGSWQSGQGVEILR